jgi:hypothetical protein
MAKQKPAARGNSRSKSDKTKKTDTAASKNGGQDDVAKYEQELADYLQERIKPGLNSGAIPLLARSIAKDLAHRQPPNGSQQPKDADPDDDKSSAGASAESEESKGETEEPPDFEADMREFQAELGSDWILRFSVQGEKGWLTAEKDDGTQHVEAQTAAVLAEAVQVLKEGGGRSS